LGFRRVRSLCWRFSVELPRIGDDWWLQIVNNQGTPITLQQPIRPYGIFWRFTVLLSLAPGESAPVTGEGIRVIKVPDRGEPGDAETTSIQGATFKIIDRQDEATDLFSYTSHKLISQGGDYSAIFGVTVLERSEPNPVECAGSKVASSG